MRNLDEFATMPWQRLLLLMTYASAAVGIENDVKERDDCASEVCVCNDGMVKCSKNDTLTSFPVLSADMAANTIEMLVVFFKI